MSDRVRLPTDIELEDRLAFGLTFRQLAILGAGAVAGYGISVSVSALAPLPGAPRRPALAPLDLPVRTVLRSGVVELTDGSYCLLLRASSTSFALRSEEEQAALVEAFGRFLNSVADPLEIVIASEPVDLEARAEACERAALELPNAALRRAALGHARFLSQLASGEEVRRREILLVLAARARDRQAAQTALERRRRRRSSSCARILGVSFASENAGAADARRLLPRSFRHHRCLKGAIIRVALTRQLGSTRG